MSQQWIYRSSGREFGPLAFDVIIQLAKKGTITANDEVKMGADGKWRRAGSIGQLVAVLPFAAPTTPTPLGKPKSANSLMGTDAGTLTKPKSSPGGTATPTRRSPENQPTIARPKSSPAIPATSPQVKTSPKPLAKSSAAIAPPISDTEIIERAREALKTRNLPGLARVELEANSGVVIARGSLTSEGERLLAMRILRQTPGVIKVIDILNLVPTKSTPRSQPAIRAVPSTKVTVGNGPGTIAQLVESIKGEYRSRAIAGTIAVGLLAFWFYPSGPTRPVAVHPVKGKVILDGQPLANAAIVLHRVGESKLPANLHPRAKATADGCFALETFDAADGAPDGEFVATVFLNEEFEADGEKQAGPNILPAVYSRPETSPFKIRITSSTKELQPLELTKG